MRPWPFVRKRTIRQKASIRRPTMRKVEPTADWFTPYSLRSSFERRLVRRKDHRQDPVNDQARHDRREEGHERHGHADDGRVDPYPARDSAADPRPHGVAGRAEQAPRSALAGRG